jgi:hypothetical protein
MTQLHGVLVVALLLCACAASRGKNGTAAPTGETTTAAAPETLVTPNAPPDRLEAPAAGAALGAETAAPPDTALLWSFETGG